MHRCILVIDASNEAKSSFINKLMGQSITGKPSEFLETEFGKHDQCLYTFITVPKLYEEHFNQNAAQAKSAIRQQLLTYEKNGIHLIIFYTNNKPVSLLSYNTFNFIIWNLSRAIPAICVVNTGENDNNTTHWDSQNELTNYIIKNYPLVRVENNLNQYPKTMDDAWEAIKKYSLKATIMTTSVVSSEKQRDEARNSSGTSSMIVKPVENQIGKPSQIEENQSLQIVDQSNLTTDAFKKLTPDLCQGYENSMYNPINTHIQLLMKNCTERQLIDSPNNCVLITTGSFNPIHRSHLQNLLRVKQCLENEQQTPWNVLMGYISPTHDVYVHNKLGDTAWISGVDRCQLCESAIRYEGPEFTSWVTVSRGECEWKDGFVDFGPVTENLRNFLNNFLYQKTRWLKYPLTVVYVCGLDHYNKCQYVDHMMKQKDIACAIVYRSGYDEQYILHPKKLKQAIYIPLTDDRNKVEDVSSTRLRKYYETFTGDRNLIPEYVCPAVHEYMLKKYKK